MEKVQQIRYFLFSQYFSDGIRITLEIIIPAIIFSYLGEMETGLALSLGALCVSISDGPGPVRHKRNGMLFCNILVFISAYLTGMLNGNALTLGLLILIASFFFTMFSVFGSRATSVGFAALLILILQMTKQIPAAQVFKESLLILLGGIWYMAVALLFYHLTPYRAAQRSLGKCIHETANYLLIKSAIYDPSTDLDKDYSKLMEQQIVVNDLQNATRELLFKNRQLLKESTRTGRLMVLTFVDVVDLFEHIMASWYDYDLLRKKFGNSGILEEVSVIIKNIAEELSGIGEAIQAKSTYKKQFDLINSLNLLKEKIDALSDTGSTIILKKILVNLRTLGEKVDDILKYFNRSVSVKGHIRTDKEYARFVSHSKINWEVFKNNLTFISSAFRHSLRVAITCMAGFLVSKIFLHGHHSYWIVMTIIIILKPAFSLTKKKNADRLLGTIGGGIIGLLVLFFIHDKTVLFAILIFCMLGTYTFKIANYIVMVIFLTPYVLILFHFLGLGALNVAGERLMDTAIGSALAALANYFIFPEWESGQLKNYMEAVLKANMNYLEKLQELLKGNHIPSLEYNVVRKELFVSTANLSSALQRMLSEPKSKQKHRKHIHEFVVLNNILSSNIASLAAEMMQEKVEPSQNSIPEVKSSIKMLNKSLSLLNNPIEAKENISIGIKNTKNRNSGNDEPLKEQLAFIQKIAGDIQKVTAIITGNNTANVKLGMG